jgi:hypothetical protein
LTLSRTIRRGLSEEIGSWKIICTCVRAARRSARDSAVRSVPSNTTEPLVGGVICMIARPVVDLPQPDSPTIPSVSPRSTSKLMPATALTFAEREIGNSTTRSSTRSTTSPSRRCALPVPAISACRPRW